MNQRLPTGAINGRFITMPRRLFSILLLILILLAGISPQDAAGRPKTDVVTLKNGDQITCEIKSMSKGKIKVKTDSMGTIDIEWLDIASLKSEFYFRVEAENGKRYFGALELPEDGTSIRIASMGAIVALEKVNVVEITPIETSFFEKINGSLSVGFSYTRASQVAEFTFDWTSKYIAERNMFDFSANTIITDRRDSTNVAKRVDVTFAYTRLLKRKWTGNSSLTMSRNDELDLKRRFLLSLTSGVSPVKNNHDILIFSAGLAGNVETSTNDIQTQSLEGVLSASYSRFNYNTPKTDINTSVEFYPSFTERGRYRFNLDIKFRREIVSDLFFDVSYYYDYDSQASSGEGQKRDYGIILSIGWTY